MPAAQSASVLAWGGASLTAFGLIFIAEMGDKSQIVCMTLAARHRHAPVLAGASAAFALLNALAVAFGASLAQWLPDRVLGAGVALLFGLFGILALRAGQDQTTAEAPPRATSADAFLATFGLLLVAEFGDKTQLAVAGLASTQPPLAVWTGATLALTATSALGIVLGCALLKRIPARRLHQISGILFLVLAGVALTRAL